MPTYKIEMLWDCSSCDTKAIGGTKDQCPNCGAAHDTKRDPWYMPNDTSRRNRITDKTKLEMAAAGPNWTCEHCSGTQRNPDGSCSNCSAPRSEVHAELASGRPSEDCSPKPSPVRESSPRQHVPPVQDEEPDWTPPRDYTGLKIFGVVASAIILITGVLWLLFHKRPVDLEVTSVKWTQTIQVERYKQVAQDGFDEDKPKDAENVVNEGSRIHHYDKILDHYEKAHSSDRVSDGEDCVDIPETCHTTPVSCRSNDNGTADCSGGDRVCTGGGQRCTTRYKDVSCTHDEPVYREEPRYEDHFRWTVWRWKPQRSPSHSGKTTQTTWPDEAEICLNCEVGVNEQERVGGRRGTYEVHFVDQERTETFDHEPDSEGEFHKFPVGSKHPALYSIAGGLEFQPGIN